MERRVAFIAGDLFVNLVAGIAGALSAEALIPSWWHPLVSMPLGMFVGGLSGSAVALVFMPLLGLFEVMLPAMLAGMVAGMAAPMFERPALAGASMGLAAVAWVYLLTAFSARSGDGRRHRA